MSVVDDITHLHFDLHKYIGRYSGNTKINRLQLIFEYVPNLNLKHQAAELLLTEIMKSTSNSNLYTKTVSKIESEFVNFELPKLEWDKNWISTTDSLFFSNLEKIENELTIAKSTMSKESMRLKYLDLGYLYYERGKVEISFRLHHSNFNFFKQHILLYLYSMLI